jgi:uncharacterized membrane protein YraQ (UPF0718 family)
MLTWIWTLAGEVAADVARTVATTWPFLVLSIVAAAAVVTYVGTERLEALLRRRVWLGTVAAVALATLTPFCSCGTTAILLGGLAASAPWAPLVAFMVASPLTSPAELLLSAGLFGWPFALTFFVGTIVIGLAAGGVTARIERTGWLHGQARITREPATCGADTCEVSATREPAPCGDDDCEVSAAEARSEPTASGATLTLTRPTPTVMTWQRLRLDDLFHETLVVGRRLVVFFLAFTALGYLVIEAIPTSWITTYLGGDSPMAVPLAALLGVPAYVNTEASLPLVAALMDGGMGTGAALAFLVTGAGTSIGAVTGLLVIARRRVVGLVVAILVVAAVLLGGLGTLVL